MTDLDIKIVIDELLTFAYDGTIERINAIEDAPRGMVYKSFAVQEGNFNSYLLAYSNYYCGCLEGILFTRFLEEFQRMPTPSENAFLKESISTRFEDLKTIVSDLAQREFKKDNP